MAQQLKNILHFSLPSGGSQTLPHGLNIANGQPVVPDVIEADASGFEITADDMNVTVSGVGDVDILVEHWISTERSFGSSGVTSLSPQPFIVNGSGGGAGSGIPTPAFAIVTTTIYARTTGSDTTGNGRTIPTAYRTLQRAVRDVPNIIGPGQNYIVDITGIDETLPTDYVLPVWKAPVELESAAGVDPYFFLTGQAVAIQAIPQLVASIPPADAVINAGDVLSMTQDPITQMYTITLNVARPSWGTSSVGGVGSGLKGKFAIGAPTYEAQPVVYQNTPSTISLASDATPTFPIQLMEPSAHLHAAGGPRLFASLTAINCDSIAFNGLKITSDNGALGLYIEGLGISAVQLCELESASLNGANDFQCKYLTNWFYGFPNFSSTSYTVSSSLLDNTTSGPFLLNGPPLIQATFRCVVLDNSDPINVIVFVPYRGPKEASTSLLAVTESLIRGSTGPGISWHGGSGFVQNCDIYGCAGPAIVADLGHGVLQVLACGSSGGANGGLADAAIFVNDGAAVKVDDATASNATPLQGGAVGQDMQVGSGALYRTWSDFNTGASGRPALNEFDFVTHAGAGGTFDNNAAAASYVSGTGSRLYEDASP